MNMAGKGFLGHVIGFSLRFRGVVLILAAVLIGFGLYSLPRAKYDVFPEFAPPQVVIQTEAPGLGLSLRIFSTASLTCSMVTPRRLATDRLTLRKRDWMSLK